MDHAKQKGVFEVIKLFSCSTQLSMKFFMLINLILLKIANSYLLSMAEHENFFANKYDKRPMGQSSLT